MRKALDLANDVTTTKTSLYETVTHKLIVLTSSANTIRKYNASSYYHLSGTVYGYSGWYQTVYSGSYLLSSSYALFDVTFGHNSTSPYASSSCNSSSYGKTRIYKQFAQKLLGNASSSFIVDGTTYNDLYFIMPKRTIYHDKVRPGYTSLTSSTTAPTLDQSIQLCDQKATGTLSTLYGGNVYSLVDDENNKKGFVFYDAGVIAVSSSFYPEANLMLICYNS